MKKLKGLHLWEVSLLGHGNTLNILTTRHSHEVALSKARTFIKQHQGEYVGATPRDLKYHGTIDA